MRPFGERLAVLALLGVTTCDPLDEERELFTGHLQAARLPPERSIRPERTAKVHLEPVDRLALGVAHDRSLEPDVSGLDTRTRVRAAVDVQRKWCVEVGECLFEMVDGGRRERLGLDD